MAKKLNYIDKVLISLKRKYGKDELVAALIKELSEKNFKIGALESEVHHLEYRLKNVEGDENREAIRLAKIQTKREQLYTIQKDRIKALQKKVKLLTRIRDDLLFRFNNKKS